MKVAVIGSGLSGLACARALIRRGIKPIIIDSGTQLEAPVQAAVDRLRVADQRDWNAVDLELIRENESLGKGGIPRKLVFGSDYVYAQNVPEAELLGENVKAAITLAKGGFGNAWGAAVLPADRADLKDWPRETIDLEPHYRAIFKWLPLAGQEDDLARHFALFAKPIGKLDLTPQGEALCRDLRKADLQNVTFGQARLAVHTQGAPACRYCGLCLSGCVFGSIFNPAADIERLRREAAIDYRPGWLLVSVAEAGARVLVSMRRIEGNEIEQHEFDYVFLAAGAISTTRIMLESLRAYETPVELHDSQKFLLPLFRLSGAAYDVQHMNSLASLFLELRLHDLGNNWMHIQVSTVNDFLLRKFRVEGRHHLEALLSPLLRRFLLAWCSLHSRHSARMVLTLQRQGAQSKLHVGYTELERAQRSVRTAVRAFGDAAPHFRSFIVPWLTWLSTPGAGNHLAGSFPMQSASGSRFTSDTLGRPSGFERLHIADSAVMPSVPATTIALVTMANADRIATRAPLD